MASSRADVLAALWRHVAGHRSIQCSLTRWSAMSRGVSPRCRWQNVEVLFGSDDSCDQLLLNGSKVDDNHACALEHCTGRQVGGMTSVVVATLSRDAAAMQRLGMGEEERGSRLQHNGSYLARSDHSES